METISHVQIHFDAKRKLKWPLLCASVGGSGFLFKVLKNKDSNEHFKHRNNAPRNPALNMELMFSTNVVNPLLTLFLCHGLFLFPLIKLWSCFVPVLCFVLPSFSLSFLFCLCFL